MPLLLRGLDLPDNDLRASVIDTLLATTTTTTTTTNGPDGAAPVASHAASLLTFRVKQQTVHVEQNRLDGLWADRWAGREVLRGCHACGVLRILLTMLMQSAHS